MLDFNIILTYSILIIVFMLLASDRFPPALIAVGATAFLLASGLITTQDMLHIFSSKALITIACMFVIAGALSEAGFIDAIGEKLKSWAQKNQTLAIGTLLAFVFVLSAFMNNTPTVIILTPVMMEIARSLNQSPQRYLIPLSYVAIMGGTTTLIGTSTNILIDGIAQDKGIEAFNIFTITGPALIMAAAGCIFLLFLGRFFLPDGHEPPSPRKLLSLTRRFMQTPKTSLNVTKVGIALMTLAIVVTLAAFDVMPIAGLAFLGAVFVLITNCITLERAYYYIDWNVLLLIFGMLGLGVAMQKTGAAEILVENSMAFIKPYGPLYLLACVYILTSFLTETITNNAVAVILTPLIISITDQLGLNTTPYLIALMLASSASFSTPVGYQTNTYVYLKGNYRFRDFLRIGLPMNMIMLVLALLVIPMFWPLKS